MRRNINPNPSLTLLIPSPSAPITETSNLSHAVACTADLFYSRAVFAVIEKRSCWLTALNLSLSYRITPAEKMSSNLLSWDCRPHRFYLLLKNAPCNTFEKAPGTLLLPFHRRRVRPQELLICDCTGACGRYLRDSTGLWIPVYILD